MHPYYKNQEVGIQSQPVRELYLKEQYDHNQQGMESEC